jgi:organic radical activating enzyme
LALLYECSLNCAYCCLSLSTGKRAKSRRVTLEQWKEFVENFPLKIKELHLCGGEPSLLSWMPRLANWLLDKGHHVTIYTNLHNVETLCRIRPSKRLMIISTYHHQDDALKYTRSYERLTAAGYEVRVGEMNDGSPGWKKVMPYSKLKTLYPDTQSLKEISDQERQLIVAPDLTVYSGCHEMYFDKGVY